MSKNIKHECLQPTFIRFEALEAPPENVSEDVNLIFNWAKELKTAHKADDNEAWWLAGRAVTILNDDVEYCRQILKYAAWHAGFHFYSITGSSITATLKSLKSTAFEQPFLLYIEPGSWMFKTEDNVPTKIFNKITVARSIIRSLIKMSNSRAGSAIVTSISKDDFGNFDEEFRQVHLFNRRFHLEAPALTDVVTSFIHVIGEDNCDESLTIKAQQAGKLLQIEFKDERRQALVALGMKRLAKIEQRKVGYNDLLYFVANGTEEFADKDETDLENANRVAIHEAGHAVIAMIDSDGQNIPEYVSIINTNNYKGVMIDSVAYHHTKSNIFTYQQFRHKVRVALAGRVAEHLVLGAENVGCYAARQDLENATDITGSMFALYGISPNMEDSDGAMKNLIVLSEGSAPTLLDSQRIDQMVNTYLEKQYKCVLNALQTHRGLLDAIAQALITKKVLNQEALKNMLNEVENTKQVFSDNIVHEK